MGQANRLQAPAAPNLPISPTEYSQSHEDVLNNALRLYFNQLSQSFAALYSNNGGAYINTPYITAIYDADQYAPGNDQATKVLWNSGTVNGFTLQSNAAYATRAGVYKIDYSLQLVNTAQAAHTVTVWLKVNGNDVPNSASFFSLAARKSSTEFTYVVAYSHITYEMNPDDYVELWWATDQAYNTTGPVDGIYIYHEGAQTTPYAHAAVPSALGTITFVSALQA